ncbi:hypothetical protein ANANG_G00221540 [Anguilla anguilla]|uniref:Bromodomain adjacent to zinc finger domain protein 2A n=1 Tax=Anguilla anguilla TaxID=7936 RepID=A0A9D3RSQ0_ANGAN|nr:hypothetical protein ANANG_G00221540 [Anguilla anguilla]
MKKVPAKATVKATAKGTAKGAPKGTGKGSAKLPKAPKVEAPPQEDDDEDEDETTANGEVQRRRIATEEQVKFPLLNGWRREVRVRRCENRLKGETWYYSPCGKRMKQFPEVIKYLSRHPVTVVTREHFSFSPRMPVGDFLEERETPQGVEWVLLADEEVPSMIMAITGRRGRPPNPDRVRPRPRPRARASQNQKGPARRPGRPPKDKMADLLLKKLEVQETLSEEEKEKLIKMMKKMRRKARNKKKEETKIKKVRQGKRKAKVEKGKEAKEQEEKEGTPETGTPKPAPEPKKQRRRKRAKAEEKAEEVVPPPPPERAKRGCGARSKAKALAKAKAEAEAQAAAAAAAKRQAERRAQAQRRLQERKRQQLLLEELKKPTEDMCITDHKALPVFSRLPGLMLSGRAFSHCLAVVEFLHSYGKPGELQDLLVKLVQAALRDPGLPPYYQSVKILGEKLADLELNRSSVSEGLRVFLEARGFEADVCSSLRSKPFQALPPDAKAAMLGFLVDELNSSNIVISEIDKTLENMAIYRKNKWGIEGKLRRLKAALARRTGRSEVELCLEERRRSARVAEEESLSLEEGVVLERGSRRARREEPKLSEGESPTTASVPELERQIDKLTKRQVFFRKKLLQCSHTMRAVSLGQDRYRRRYWALPHLGGVLVEGAEEILGSGDVLVKEEEEPQVPAEPPVSPVKTEPATDLAVPRGRGRPRKIKPEVELHLRTAKNRRRRRSSKAGAEESPAGGPASQNGYDVTQSAFLAWLSQSQGSIQGSTGDGLPGACPQDGDSVKEMAEKQGQWFNLLPKTPCDGSSLLQSPLPNSASKDQTPPPGLLPIFAVSPLQSRLLFSALSPQVSSTPCPVWFNSAGFGRRRRASGPSLTPTDPSALGYSIPGTKRRGRPPSKLLQEIEQKYFTQLIPRPIPTGMVRGWWWIRKPEELSALVEALHPRGIREKALHKHLSKHSEYLAEVCAGPISDPVFQERAEPDPALAQAVQEPWAETAKAMEADVRVLQWVEDLEQRVIMADLQQKKGPQMERSDDDCSAESAAPEPQGFSLPEPDSTRTDLEYHQHAVEAQDDWIVKTKREWSGFLRLQNNPLDLAPPAEVESVESEITPRLRLWRQALDRCRSSSQLSLCLLQLERSVAWERSVIRVTCLVCRKGDNDEYLLLCDGCDRGCHMYCLRPKISQIPEGDWFCPCARPRRTGTPSGRAAPPNGREGASSACSPSKRRRMVTRNQPDLTFCEIILMEMEAHADAWPFLEPVNPRLVPGYRRIVKHPMDFLTMRERLLQGGYCSCEEFAADAQLVFDNCQLFNEDTSEVGLAGHAMRRFFQSRWAEFYQDKDQ